eukprot:CAMPEP_0182880504 /NCGR_PEP_ID=MMETSP0034_2-20130328/16607_1 /TAXON_ID=156128 /ORGANISM="Nephroselmis pyriformis, Strain CCMP717" /LENGTH=92 /DNA_ID=CAMNT_0025013493 /DNA_START=97 /DNA_END=372 /DNA_ORIENTATION=-
MEGLDPAILEQVQRLLSTPDGQASALAALEELQSNPEELHRLQSQLLSVGPAPTPYQSYGAPSPATPAAYQMGAQPNALYSGPPIEDPGLDE